VWQERAAGVGEDGAAPDALEERDAEIVLEQADARADRGLHRWMMLPETRSGIADASATRSPSTPFTRSSGSRTASSPVPIAQVAQG
jgi:hypothetical protein